ncbi:MAG: DUF433 domain-containing protein [Ktedonobacterales bacterium]
MTLESDHYVQARDGNLYVGATRITVETVIFSWQVGRAPEQIHESYPHVPLFAVYGTIAYSLEHKDAVDAFFRETQERAEARQAAIEAEYPEFFTEMRRRFAELRARQGDETSVI